jgi:hypothetical protein
LTRTQHDRPRLAPRLLRRVQPGRAFARHVLVLAQPRARSAIVSIDKGYAGRFERALDFFDGGCPQQCVVTLWPRGRSDARSIQEPTGRQNIAGRQSEPWRHIRQALSLSSYPASATPSTISIFRCLRQSGRRADSIRRRCLSATLCQPFECP